MADSSLLPVIVGGLIAMGGVVISGGITLAVNLMQTRKDEKKQRKDKFEELVASLFEYEHWMEVVRDTYMGQSPKELVPTPPPSPFAKLHAIAAIYFPEFENETLALENAGRSYWMWIIAARKKLIAGEQNFLDGYEDAYKAFYAVLRPLRDRLIHYAKRGLHKS